MVVQSNETNQEPPQKTGGSKITVTKKKKLIIKKKLPQKKDISEHFGAAKYSAPKAKASPFLPIAPQPVRKKQVHSKGPFGFRHARPQHPASRDERQEPPADSARSNLILQTAPPTAAQARGRTMRSSHKASDKKYRDKEKENEQEREENFLEAKFRKKIDKASRFIPQKIEIMENIQVGELAKKMNLRPNEVIGKLMRLGEMVSINKVIDAETATLLAAEYNCQVKVISLYEETLIQEEEDLANQHEKRPPVVTIMGHVDHGKTMLLDRIRKSNVIAGEAGAITQHIGAYQVTIPQGSITFLDTPGHEAFSAMRARGASVTDLVVLVVAANDSVKQQSVEAIAHAREAKVPIIAAINKIDLPDANIEQVKKDLSKHGLRAEEEGGDTIICEISAKEGTGIELLLEMILLQAELMKLTANPCLRAVGHVIEAKVDSGKGPVSTILVGKGTLREGDAYVAGVFSGRVRAMYDDYGKSLKEALPATPVEISGLNGVPEAGDPFQVVASEKYARETATKRQHYKQIKAAAKNSPPNLRDLGSWVKTHKKLNLIIKADVQGSVEAIRDGLQKLSTNDIQVHVIHGAAGSISESDVHLASASKALIIGFQVRATPRVVELADRTHVNIKYYNVIYNVIEEVRKAMEGMLEPDRIEELTAKAEVRQIFKISRLGNVAGCKVLSGVLERRASMRVIRDNIVVYTGKMKSLRRLKENVNEVHEGFECGLSLESYNDLREGDQLEAFQIREVARKLEPSSK